MINRRKFVFILSATALTMAYNACAPGFVTTEDGSLDSLASSGNPDDATLPTDDPVPVIDPSGNKPPIWDVIPTISFVQGVPSRISIAAYVTDPEKDLLTITKNTAALPAGVTFDVASKSFVYDGSGPVSSTSGHILTATEG